MARFRYDRSSKWLLEHHGDSLVRLAGWTDIASWRAVTPEVVQPRQLPDGLLEVRRTGHSEPDLFVIEIATYPDNRVPEQLLRDAALVYLDRGRLPEVLVFVLHPKGNVRVADHVDIHSPGGLASWRASWRVIELWTVPATDLFAFGDVWLIPWVPLTQIDGPMEPVLARCREAIERDAMPEERENLIVVTAVLAGLRYDEDRVLAILGGSEAMIESPILRRFVAERTHKFVFAALEARFGPVPDDIRDAVRAIKKDYHVEALHEAAMRCVDLEAFRQALAAPPPPEPDSFEDE